MATLTNDQIRRTRIFRTIRPGDTYVANLTSTPKRAIWLGNYGEDLPPIAPGATPILMPLRKNSPSFLKRKKILSALIDDTMTPLENGLPSVSIGTYEEVAADIAQISFG